MKNKHVFITTLLISFLFSGISYAETTYQVRKGDNFFKIAKKFNVSPDDIIRVNAIDPSRLKPGTRITIPPKNSGKPVTVPSSHATDDNQSQHGELSVHIVQKGDTISAIARKYSVPVQDLMDINNLRSSRLKIGQKIALKRPEVTEYIVRKGDTIWDIAKKFDVDQNKLMDINGLETYKLKPGQKILLRDPVVLTDVKQYEAILSQGREEITSNDVSEDSRAKATMLQGIEERLILFAKKMLDVPYRFGGNSPLGIDCSAYVKKVYSLIGIDLPRSAREQFQEGTPVDEHELSVGDLVFFRTYASYPSHVGIYLGNNLFIHASSKKKRVTIDSLDTPFYLKRYIGAKRLLGMGSKIQDLES